ncbi:MAG: radical SAM protein [Deltaproteobacteria bacterium]|nr:radical SAM protein [Deltaproteobacteria bacterium]MBW2535639.1 radical SAM protein [Deltaproteobacteria bacterium]
MKHRFETFGGIIASEEPPLLAFVDRQFMRELGCGDSPLWTGADESIGLLSAPTEVHLAATNACPVRCGHCYMQAGEPRAAEMDTGTFRRALQALADMGVFHVALGGGEALFRSDLFELAAATRQLGMVPNLTISGAVMNPELARRMAVFGQVNVSIDGVGARYGAFRDAAQFERADRAIAQLRDAGVPTGINCVVGRTTFDGIAELFEYAKRVGCNEIEFLRLKPTGRAAARYLTERTTYEQNVALAPLLLSLSERHGLCAKVDCSFVPMLCYHRPPLEALEATATYGCEAANVLLGVHSDGTVAGCSFLPAAGVSVFELRERWADHDSFRELRSWPERGPEPCRSCAYLSLCKGGCHAVAAFVSGSPDEADPDCPWVVEHRRGGRGR